MGEHARIEGAFEPLPHRGAIISNATGLIFEADDADSQLLHEPNALYCDLTIDFPHLQEPRRAAAIASPLGHDGFLIIDSCLSPISG